MDFPGGSEGEESTCNAGDLGSAPGLGRSPGEGNSYPLQNSCPENSMDRDRQATVHEVAKNQIQLSNFHLYCTVYLKFAKKVGLKLSHYKKQKGIIT